MYATSMKDRILAAARTKAREIQEAALPGTAAKELEEALDAGDGGPEAPATGGGLLERAEGDLVDDAAADIDESTSTDHDGHRAAS